jgi:hypothetical protein
MRSMVVVTTVAVGLVLGLGLVACGRVSGQSSGSAPGDSGVKGLVVATPSCPVDSTDGSCPPQRVQADVEVLDLTPPARGSDVAGSERMVIAVAHADSGGRFQVNLAPGSYVLQAVPPSGASFSAKPVPVQVKAHAYTEVTVILDTGIR